MGLLKLGWKEPDNPLSFSERAFINFLQIIISNKADREYHYPSFQYVQIKYN